MNKPLIGITTYGQDEKKQFPLPREYVDAVRRARAIPLLIPPGEIEVDELLSRIDGLILAGGGDLNPAHYDGDDHPEVYMVDDERDDSEFELTRRAIDAGMPTFGICRGLQVVNVALGGSLHEHLPDVVGEDVVHRLPPREPTEHAVAVDADSRLGTILGELEFESASWHHQSVDRVASRMRTVARAPDGTIEALEDAEHPWLICVQWHPELTAHRDPAQQQLFDEFVRTVVRGMRDED